MAPKYGTDEWESAYQAFLAEKTKDPPPYTYFTPEWAALYEKTIQGDADYREAAKTWEGTVVLHVEAAPEFGIDFDIYVFMDLWHGECRSIRIVPQEAGEAGDFVITGSLERWTQVAKKELDSTKGMMQGKLKLKGDLPTIVRAVRASQRLTDLSADVGGFFPTELETSKVEELKAEMNDFASRVLG
jgi:putative sterol carrier protein